MFIKIMNKSVATRLKKAGFSYTTEEYKQPAGSITMYCFQATPEFHKVFIKYQKYFEPGQIVTDNRMRFNKEVARE